MSEIPWQWLSAKKNYILHKEFELDIEMTGIRCRVSKVIFPPTLQLSLQKKNPLFGKSQYTNSSTMYVGVSIKENNKGIEKGN